MMIATNTYLNVPYAQKDEAKALGARWDNNQRKWYVPAGIAVEPFSRWLSEQADITLSSNTLEDEGAAPYLVQTAQGIALSELLNSVQAAVAQTFRSGVWVLVEVIEARRNNGHLYLELSERSADGRVIATARGIIWASAAHRILPEFEQRTGVSMAAGIKLLLRATPSFHVLYGLSLQIDAINADYTLGDLEATKKEIRHRLNQEGIFKANKQLPAPWDYQTVIVISPEKAAGLGDFQAEAKRLQHSGLCEFIYAHSRFQGEGAAQEVAATLMNTVTAQQKAGRKIDAVVIIRGGGAVNDLAWLNQYELVRTVCLLTIPVLTGIGHERDSTVLDEVAHSHFDTPSKVIAGIEQLIFQRAMDAKAMYQAIASAAQQELAAQASQIASDFSTIQNGVLIQLARARQQVQQQMTLTHAHATTLINHARQISTRNMQYITERSAADIRLSQQTIKRELKVVEHEARRSLQSAASSSAALFREIAGQGPDKTLARGFALVRKGGDVISSAKDIQTGDIIDVEFKDSQFKATAVQIFIDAERNE